MFWDQKQRKWQLGCGHHLIKNRQVCEQTCTWENVLVMSPTTSPTLASLAPMTNNSFTCLTLPLTLVMATSNCGKGCWIKLISFCYDTTIGSGLVDYGAWSPLSCSPIIILHFVSLSLSHSPPSISTWDYLSLWFF